jgi:hypothetical protein
LPSDDHRTAAQGCGGGGGGGGKKNPKNPPTKKNAERGTQRIAPRRIVSADCATRVTFADEAIRGAINPDLLTAAERLQYEGYLRREEINAAVLALAKDGTPIKQIAVRGHERRW